jgi:hypothetical protein
MKENRLPLFESFAAVFAVSLISLFTALPAAPDRVESSAALHAGLTELRAAAFRTSLANDGFAESAEELQERLTNYLSQIPTNSVNDMSTIRAMASEYDRPILNGSAGWVYVPATGRIFPDLAGADEQGTPYSVW